jgi:cytochrome c oxidase subunit 3
MAIEHTVAHQFDDEKQQREAAGLGMWTFLVTEVMLFGGLVTGYTVYRILYTKAFHEASTHLYAWIGAANTAILLCSSLTMALAVHAAEARKRRQIVGFLVATVVLGVGFLVLKGVEYAQDIHDGILPGVHFKAEEFAEPGHARLFFIFYWVMTSLHALHMTIGVFVLCGLAWLAQRGRFEHNPNAVEMGGLYWHFVDIVWIFLFPLLYLIGKVTG